MGGLALRKFGIETRRVDRAEYDEILSYVKSVFPKGREIYFYREKFSFGDLDFLCVSDHKERIEKRIKENFNPRKIFVNAGVYSFDYLNFQIDLITKPERELDIAQTYLSWNDASNLFGRAYHAMNLCYGSQGLVYRIRQSAFSDTHNISDHVIKEMVLSREPREIFEFMDYDYDRFLFGFDTLEDIYKFACSTKYFNAKNFQFENLNHTNKTRNKKRPTFCGFVKWLEDNPEYDKAFEFGRKSDWIDFIDEKFPIKAEIEKARVEYFKRRELHEKFNGSMIIDWAGLTGKELGNALNKFKKEKDWWNYLEQNTAEQIKRDFLAQL